MPSFFHPLRLARCDNREVVAQDRPEISQLIAWWEAGNQVQGIYALSFDFFVDWSNDRLQRVAWLKRATALRLAELGPRTAEIQVPNALEHDAAFNRLAGFCRANALDLSAMVFDDQQDWSSDNSWLVHAWLAGSASNPTITAAARLLPALKAEIQRLSGGPVAVGRKGLGYGTSRLECALSHTEALWPGDVDLILADAASNVPFAIIELKKHTNRSSIKFADQKLSNYYPYPDGRKYNRLSLLASQLTSKPIPIIALYYSTDLDEHDIVLELIEGSFCNLKGTTRLKVPMRGLAPSVLADSVIEAIASMM